MSLEAIKQRLNATDYELGWVVGTIEAEVALLEMDTADISR